MPSSMSLVPCRVPAVCARRTMKFPEIVADDAAAVTVETEHELTHETIFFFLRRTLNEPVSGCCAISFPIFFHPTLFFAFLLYLY